MYLKRILNPIGKLVNTFHNPENYWNAKKSVFY